MFGKKNKKGIANSMFTILIVVFVFILSFAFGYITWIEANKAYQSLSDDFADAETKAKINDLTNIYLNMDWIIVVFFVVLWAGFILTAINLPVKHPVFFMLYLIVILIFGFVAAVVRDVGAQILNQSTVNVFTEAFPIMTYFMDKLHILSILIAIIAGVIFYARSGRDTGGVQTNAP